MQDIQKRIPASARYFISCDLLSAYHQIKIMAEDRYASAFVTEHGIFKYNRGAMGLSATSDAFTAAAQRIFGGIEGVLLEVDDLLIFGSKVSELERNFQAVCDGAQ